MPSSACKKTTMSADSVELVHQGDLLRCLFYQKLRPSSSPVFFFNDTATTEIYTLSLHDALPILLGVGAAFDFLAGNKAQAPRWMQDRGLEWVFRLAPVLHPARRLRSEEHTSELQSRQYLVCRLLLAKKQQ